MSEAVRIPTDEHGLEFEDNTDKEAENGSSRRRPKRLLAFAAEYGVEFAQRKELLGRGEPPQFATRDDYDKAIELLAAVRRSAKNFKEPSERLINRLKSPSKKAQLDEARNWTFSAKERAAALEDNLRKGGNVGLSQALLEHGGRNLLSAAGERARSTASKHRKHRVLGAVDTEAWLHTAVMNNDCQHVVLLASRLSQVSGACFDPVFSTALSSGASAAIITELVRYGVDPNLHAEKVALLVQQKRADELEAVLRSSRPLDSKHVDAALFEAVTSNDATVAAMLLAYGADPNHRLAQHFLDALRSRNMKMVCLMLAGAQDEVRLRPQHLDSAVDVVVEARDELPLQRRNMLEVLLSAGATRTSRSLENELFRAVKSFDVDMVRLLVSYGTSADHDEARCVRAALEAQDLDVVEILLRGCSSPSKLSKAMPYAMRLRTRSTRLCAVKSILSKGARGSEVDQAFVDSILQEDDDLFNELRSAGADANYSDGLVFESAFKARTGAYLRQLCDHHSASDRSAALLVPMALHPLKYSDSRTKLILKACGRHRTVLDKALVDEVLHDAREAVVSLLLRSGASADASDGAPMCHAVTKGNERALQLLLAARPSHSTLRSALRAAMTLHADSARCAAIKTLLEAAGGRDIGQDDALLREIEAHSAAGTRIVELLLKHGASVNHQRGKALRLAVNAKATDILTLLLSYHPGEEALKRVFTKSASRSSRSRLKYVTMILDKAFGLGIDLPVDLYVEQAIRENDLPFCKLLLQHGASPNRDGGKACILAAQLASPAMFEALLTRPPDMNLLLPALIRKLDNEDRLVACLQSCFKLADVRDTLSNGELLFLALTRFEEGENLIRCLLKAGCPAGATKEMQLREGGEAESVTPLIWALSRPLPGPSRAVLFELLGRSAEAKLDFVTPVTHTTALLEAASAGRHAVIERLLSLGVKPNTRDVNENTALLLATESGNLASVKALLQTRIRPNDGSLHSAARAALGEILRVLLNHGHNPNHIHRGRSALAELCLNGHSDGVDWHERAYWIIDTLIAHGADTKARYNGKSVLHLALDNEMPVQILKVLLDSSQFSDNLNHDSLLFEDPAGTVYSPLSYVEAYYSGPKSEKAKLVELLENKNCSRSLWNRQGRHPPNFTYNTMPAHLKAIVDQERLEEQRLTNDIRRRQEEDRVLREIADRNHQQLLDQQRARYREEEIEARQREARESAADARRREAERAHRLEMANNERQSLRDRHQLEINQQAALATQRQQIEDRDRARALQHEQQLAALATERRADERRLAIEQDRLHERQHQRHLELVERQDQSVRKRASEMRRVAEAARAANAGYGLNSTGARQRQINFGNDWATVD
ncbi:hypothetical protein, variant [Verruconis gallopava]|uniref:Uncharacterized protein n=1 Tax=Verruconis gallopava TaxID=253628 RepID=A0A0D1XB08_9PEZI|nr:uncharacterized protein PV09_08945 [Verruconis gallopava]XP_016209276.1 hypothetical protein, variant [Verruconis gallopava]KIV99405.1 hypothetical protein PV09_08945 [Verruconis gallopava]KIV99406.1 hypothetical protein, variant [Verruconis gallopava]